MAWTQAQIEAIEAKILELATGQMKSVTVFGRSYTKRDIAELETLHNHMKAEIAAAAGMHRTIARLRRAR